jgi:hypothetical protein
VSVESEVGIEAGLLNVTSLDRVKIDDLPLLILSVVFLPGEYILSFGIFVSRNIKNLSILNIHDIGTIESEGLEPSGVGVPHLHVVRSTSILNIE